MKPWTLLAALLAAASVQAEDVDALVARHQAWLVPADECPADVFPESVRNVGYDPALCVPDAGACFDRCQAGDVAACYNLAITLQDDRFEQQYRASSEALFLRACRLGSVSGCTNRAAGMARYGGQEHVACALRTYELGCGQFDPWACTMLGHHLATGRGIDRDVERALAVFGRSCHDRTDDEACRVATELADSLRKAADTD